MREKLEAERLAAQEQARRQAGTDENDAHDSATSHRSQP
jgi:hypothetical protein